MADLPPEKSPDSFGPRGTRKINRAEEQTVTATPATSSGPGSHVPQQDFSGQTFGSYRIVRKIAEGGMGVVYEAVQTTLDRRVALKVLNDQLASRPEFLHRFQREARAAAALNHPNIVQVHDFTSVEGRHCLIMEFIDGEDLGDYVEREGKLDVPEALDVIEQAARALQFACGKSIIHRDIKPSNLMFTSDGRMKVSDLGLAKILTETSDLTITSESLGSPHFMAPEQASDAGNADHRADIYALGITLLYLVTGKRPFDGGTPYSVVLGHINKPLPRGADLGTSLPEPVEALIRNMAAKDREDRYPDYASLLEDLQRVKAGVTPPIKAAPRRPRKTAAIGAVAVLVIAAAVIVLVASKNSYRKDATVATASGSAPVAPSTESSPAFPRRPPPLEDPGRPFEGGPPPHEMRGGLRLPMGPPPVHEFYTVPDGPIDTMLAAADAYAAQNKEKYVEVLWAYEQVHQKAAGSGREPEIDGRINKVFDAQDKAVSETMRQYETRMHEHLRARRPQEAYEVWSTFPSNLRSREVDDQIRAILQQSFPPDFSPAPPGR